MNFSLETQIAKQAEFYGLTQPKIVARIRAMGEIVIPRLETIVADAVKTAILLKPLDEDLDGDRKLQGLTSAVIHHYRQILSGNLNAALEESYYNVNAALDQCKRDTRMLLSVNSVAMRFILKYSAARMVWRPIEFAKRAMAMGSMFSFDTSVALHLQLNIERSALETRATRIASEIDLFREEISDVSASIAQVTGHLSELAAQAGQAAKETAAGSGSAASAVSNSTSALKLSSQSIEELEVSIDEISSQAERSAQLANNAVKSAERSGATAKELTGSIANINTITKMISSIAGQTNLLALNATIEAARAGEAGRGFAVVAAEVKALVSQVEAATSDIEKILQRVTQSARASEQEIGAINGVVYSLSDSALSVSVAVQQQKSAVSEIRNHMSSIIANNRSIDAQFVKLVTNSEQSAEYSGGINEVVADLRKRSQNLGKTFERFSQAIRAA